MSMTGSYPKAEILTGPERRRRWSVAEKLSKWFEHYNELHPHRALGYRSPREFIAERSTAKSVEHVSGN